MEIKTEYYFSNSLLLFPNPICNYLNIKTETQGEISLVIYDLTGRKMQEEILFGFENRITLRNYPSGIYVAVLTDESGKKRLSKFGVVK